MKFKDCGVRRNKVVFVHPQDLEKYNNDLIGLSYVLNQTITVVPNQHRNCHDYQVVWATKWSLSVFFDNDHFCTKDNDDIQAIHLAWSEYYKEYLEASGKGPLYLAKTYASLVLYLMWLSDIYGSTHISKNAMRNDSYITQLWMFSTTI